MNSRLESNAVAYEWLLRGLLGLPKKPAVINLHVSIPVNDRFTFYNNSPLQTIGLSFEAITTGGDLHTRR